MPPKTHAQEHTANAELGLERIVFFSDAVMAIAITLLAIDLKVPEVAAAVARAELPRLLADLTPRIMSFVISFVVVGIYWMSHHRYFGFIKRYDTGLMLLNMLFLLFIALMPFVASLLGRYATLPLGVIAYAAAVALTGFSISALWWYAAHNHRLVDEALDVQFIRTRSLVALVVPVIFLVSTPIAVVSPVAALASWWISPVVSLVIVRMAGRPRRHGKTSRRG